MFGTGKLGDLAGFTSAIVLAMIACKTARGDTKAALRAAASASITSRFACSRGFTAGSMPGLPSG